jgi:nitrogen regulatory protein P-II 1
MEIKRITAIVPQELIDSCERCLRKCGVPGMTIEKVRGFGEHANYFSSDLLMSNVQVVVYVSEQKAATVVDALKSFARNEHTPAGILAIESIERLVNLNTGEDVKPEQL